MTTITLNQTVTCHTKALTDLRNQLERDGFRALTRCNSMFGEYADIVAMMYDRWSFASNRAQDEGFEDVSLNETADTLWGEMQQIELFAVEVKPKQPEKRGVFSSAGTIDDLENHIKEVADSYGENY